MTDTDRSRIITAQRCLRERYLAYHRLGKGLQRKSKGLALSFGSAYHEGAEELLKGDVETACYRAMKFLHDGFKSKGIGLEESTDAAIQYGMEEQVALVEGLIRAWGIYSLPQFLETFTVLEVEKEGRANLTDDLCLMFRPDALVEDKSTGERYIISWKTAATYGKRTLEQSRFDMQAMSEMFGLQQNGIERIEGVIYQYVIKGRRSYDEWDGTFKNDSHLIYGWVRKGDSPEESDWSWKYQWPDEAEINIRTNKPVIHKLPKGYRKVAIWREYPGRVKQWVEDLGKQSINPRHLNGLEAVFPQSLPVMRRADEVESWKRQVVAQEQRIAENVVKIEAGATESDYGLMLDTYFPQHTGACFQYSGCSFIDICHHGVPAEPGELYTIRSANHPEGKGDEE